MDDATVDDGEVSLSVKNIGGIDETSMRISAGVTALVGENATNRTSLIQAIAAGLGTDEYSLKSDSEQGEVSMVVGEETYTRKIRRENDHIETDGNPYLSEPSLAELYGVLLESNEIRRAVRTGDDLRTLILDPIDTDQIQQEIGDRVDKRREIDDELDRLNSLEERLADCKARRSRREADLEELTERLAEKRAELDATERDDRSAAEAELDEKLAELQEVRTDLERVTTNLESERKSLEMLRENEETIESQYESLTPPDDAEIATLEERLEGLRTRKQSLDSTIAELQQVIRFNNSRLEDSQSPLRSALEEETDGQQAVVDKLNPAESTVTCWTCGTEVEQRSIEQMVDQLQQLRQAKSEEKNRVTSELAELKEELDSLESRKDQWSELQSRLDAVHEKIEQRQESIESLETRRETLQTRIEELEADVETLQQQQQTELLELQQEVSELEFEREQVESTLESLAEEIEEIEAELATRDDLEARREELSEELEELRTRIDRIEQDAIDAFNTHTNVLIDKLGYDNLERVWLEQTETTVQDGRRKTTEKRFELHVIRKSDTGKAYEDSIGHLSESEREIIGLVVALAGYIVHDVHEEVPFMLLDSIEMIDGNRLFDIVSYLEEYVPYLIVVLLPDHARTFRDRSSSDKYQMIEI